MTENPVEQAHLRARAHALIGREGGLVVKTG
jgi:hypothetical protein